MRAIFRRGVLYLQTNVLLCSPETKGASEVLLQSWNSEDLVTVWLLAPHINMTVSPTEALMAKKARRTPWVTQRSRYELPGAAAAATGTVSNSASCEDV